MENCLYNTTPINGFDACNLDNARQNNYAWSMSELGEYIYVGTGRNIVYQGLSLLEALGIELPPILAPEHPDNNAEIWRYNTHTKEGWCRVYKAPEELNIMGFRFMITYTDCTETTALYAAAFTITNNAYLLMSEDGCNWECIDPGLPEGFSTRTMAIHDNKLYMGATKTLSETQTTYLYVSDHPKAGWTQVNLPSNGPKGEIQSMLSFNQHLYIGTSPSGGFEVWRTKESTPESGWCLLVDQGAGDALNELPMSMEAFKGKVYVGTGIWVGIYSVDPNKLLVPPKGFDIICIDQEDTWKVVVGSDPLIPTHPTTGTRNKACCPSGFGNLFNAYCWSLQAYKGCLYIGSWDSSILWATLLKSLIQLDIDLPTEFTLPNLPNIDLPDTLNEAFLEALHRPHFHFFKWLKAFIESIETLPYSYGFDLIHTSDGKCFHFLSNNGLCNAYNYGLRTMLRSKDNHLYLGTANPFEGCEVWVLS